MRYIRVQWHHDFVDEPVILYSEIDNSRYETRKVEHYRDDRADYADSTTSTGTTLLGELPIPPIEDIAEQPEFTPVEITESEFERVWDNATQRRRRNN